MATMMEKAAAILAAKGKDTRIVVFTGAGVSAESGLGTFRDADGLWEKYRVEDICTHQAWLRNPELCVEFYNARRRDTMAAQPNAAHIAIEIGRASCRERV